MGDSAGCSRRRARCSRSRSTSSRTSCCGSLAVKRREFLGVLGSAVLPLRIRDVVFVERWSWAMGQAVHLVVYAESEQAGLDACAAALAELRRVEARLTLFDDASDLCELNRGAGKRAMHVDRDLAVVLALAEGFRRATGGAVNVAGERSGEAPSGLP